MADLLRSGLLRGAGFLHGFSLRTGGCSEGQYASLNLGRAVGDDPGRVQENHVRFARAVGFAPGGLYEVSQVHGAAVQAVEAGADAQAVRRREADVLVSAAAGCAVGVRVADCVPLLLADPAGGAVAAVHAGWRGTVAGVVGAGVEALSHLAGAAPGRLLAAILPHIRACCFEVGEDVAAQLERVGPSADTVVRVGSRPHAALANVVRAQLGAAGLSAEHVEELPGCTRCDASRFFSYRRQGARSGRHVAAIVAR